MVRGNRQANKYRNLLNEAINKSDIAKIFDSILTIGVEEMASEIYFDSFIDYGTIVIKKEGFSDEVIQYPISLHNPIITKLKIESGQMNPDVSDAPQEANISIITQTYKEASLLAKIVPTAGGEELIIIIKKPDSISQIS